MRTYGIIVGCSKCGTTSLYQYLTQHPDVIGCEEKEPNFFAGEDWERGFDWYINLWSGEGGVCLEASTLYTWHPLMPNAAERIKSVKDKGDFRFIYIMRDPIQRAESQIKYGAARGYISTKDPLNNPWLMEVSRYAQQLDKYEKRFGRERIHLTTLEELRETPRDVLRRACNFLGVSDEVEFDVGTKYNQTKDRVVPGTLWRRMRTIDWLRRLVRAVPIDYRARLRQWINPKVENAGEDFKLTTGQRRRFIDALSDDLRRLEDFYGVDTSRWNLSP
jgi:hypothetical protein